MESWCLPRENDREGIKCDTEGAGGLRERYKGHKIQVESEVKRGRSDVLEAVDKSRRLDSALVPNVSLSLYSALPSLMLPSHADSSHPIWALPLCITMLWYSPRSLLQPSSPTNSTPTYWLQLVIIKILDFICFKCHFGSIQAPNVDYFSPLRCSRHLVI